MLAFSPGARAAETTWSNTGTGSWFTDANWSGGVVPTNADNASIDNGGTSQVDGGSAAANGLVVGDAATGNLQISAGQLSTASAVLGNQAASSGVVTVTGGTWAPSSLTVGGSGTGALVVSDGAVLVGTGTITLGLSSGGVGSITQTSGVISAGQIVKGSGAGTLALQGGTLQSTADQSNFLAGFSAGNVVISGSVTVDTGSHAVGIQTAISGSGTLVKVGSGTLTLSGASTFTEGAYVTDGRLIVASNGALGNSEFANAGSASGTTASIQVNAGVSLSKGFSIDNGATFINSGTINSLLSILSSGTGGATVVNTGRITAQATFSADGVYVQDGAGSVTNTGGVITSLGEDGVWLRAGGTVKNETSGTLSGARNGVTIDGGNGTVQNLTSSVIVGKTAGVSFSGGGTVTNSGTILTTGNAGTYGVVASSTAATVSNQAGGTIQGRQTGVYLSAGGLVTNSGVITGSMTSGANNAGVRFGTVSGTLVNNGTITGGVLMGNGAHTATLNIGSVITGNLAMGTSTGSKLILGGTTGSQVLSTAVTGSTVYSGTLMKQDAGTWIIDRALASTAGVVISSGTLQIGNSGTVGSIAGNVSNSGMLAFKRNDAVSFSGTISGSGGLVQAGSGTLTLTANNTYTGTTVVQAGTFYIDASNASAVNVSGGLFGGSGTTSGAVTIANGGTIAPGKGTAGKLSTGDFTLSGTASTVVLDISGTGAGSYDQINVTGAVNLNGNGKLTLNLGSFTPALNSLFFPILNDGTDAINGTLFGLAQGDIFTVGGFQWQISYVGDATGGTFTGGNDLALMVVPEPGIWGLVAVGMLGGIWFGRRRGILAGAEKQQVALPQRSR